MAYKNREDQLAAQRRHYARNKKQRIAISAARRKEIKRYIQAVKEGKPCADCGYVYPPYVMDFDHLDPATKTCNPSHICNKGWGNKRVQEELDKCDLVCSNCHRERTHGTTHR